MNTERLLNVAKALRESPEPHAFSMSIYAHYPTDESPCGTPACAFGHYAARTDLQDVFALDRIGPHLRVTGKPVAHVDPEALEHFEFKDVREATIFFGCRYAAEEARARGFGGPFLVESATTAIEAAEWIERFVERHKRESAA